MMNEEEIIRDEADKKVEKAKEADDINVITENEPELFQMNYKPESATETIRKSGLAYSAAVALLGSIVFMLIIGWVLDTFFGTSPWLLVGGIVIGSIVGFYQFFRLTSEILKNKD